ncbi:DUF488 domain-containing protein [Piscibacillus salipiscarius]|uniref:DUF488 family protein n=1 Tax=Piscibacillus salipiscarius TaxID=299480 RepID=A0ABW5QAP0_9BACI|nr:DUF488 domain-containing protein [Piscibacillus salipiscarius]
MEFFTVGHYNHSKQQFLQLLKAAEVKIVADVRSLPGSRKNPQFNKNQLRSWLDEAGLKYQHFKKLGGRRKLSGQVGEELNSGWQNRSFHNYADYSLTEEFKQGIDELKAASSHGKVVLMCSERHPSRCHRLIISNYLKANDFSVTHIIPNPDREARFVDHELGKWGAMPIIESNGSVVYPK